MVTGNAVRVRRFRPSDIAQALKLWRTTEGIGLSLGDEPDSLVRFIRKNRAFCFSATLSGQVVGTALCGEDGRRAYIYHVAVAAEQRRSGLGRTLVGRVLDELRKRGIPRCNALVFRSNELANGFWAGLGWRNRDDLGLFSTDT